MHLRTGRFLAFGSRIVSQNSTQSRKAPKSRPLDPINEDTSSDADSATTVMGSEASLSMGDFINFVRQTNMPTTMQQPTRGVRFDIQLVFLRENKHGAKIYCDPHNNCAVKIEYIHSPFEPKVMVNYQGDHYMGVNGVKYLITPLFEDMDPTGRIFHTKADSEPSAGNPSSSKGPKHPSQSDIPTAPPISSMPGMTPEVSSK